MNKIVFLGTAGDSFVLNKMQRSSAGIIIQCNGTQLHINPGPGALYKAREAGFDSRKTTAVIVTDNTLLHANDANAIIDAMTVGCFDTNGLLLAAKSALINTEQQPWILQAYQDAVERTVIMEGNNKVECNGIHIQAIEIKNTDKHAVGIKIVTDAFSLAYTAKTKYIKRLKEQCKGVEILILELLHIHETKKENGLSIEEAKKLIIGVQPQVAILTGFGNEILNEDILEITRDFNYATHIQTVAAMDGYAFDPTSYAVQLRQKRLQF